MPAWRWVQAYQRGIKALTGEGGSEKKNLLRRGRLENFLLSSSNIIYSVNNVRRLVYFLWVFWPIKLILIKLESNHIAADMTVPPPKPTQLLYRSFLGDHLLYEVILGVGGVCLSFDIFYLKYD